MNRGDITSSARMGGLVKRYHTWPVLRQQTVGEHSWQVARIFTELFPGAVCVEVLLWIQFHDVDEVATGDPPFPLKQRYPELRDIYENIGSEVLDNMGIVFPGLTSRQRTLIKICDLLEMWEFGMDELKMGNQYAIPIINDTWWDALNLAKSLGEEETLAVNNWRCK